MNLPAFNARMNRAVSSRAYQIGAPVILAGYLVYLGITRGEWLGLISWGAVVILVNAYVITLRYLMRRRIRRILRNDPWLAYLVAIHKTFGPCQPASTAREEI